MELHLLSEPVAAGVAVLTGDEARHVARVLRHRPGDVVHATDGRGTEYELELETVDPGRVVGKVLGCRGRPRENRCRVTLAQALLKGAGLADVVDGVTQLGVAGIIPLRTRRTVAGLSPARLARVRSAAVRAIKSAAGSVLPDIGPVLDVRALAARVAEFDRVLVADENEVTVGLTCVLDPGVSSVLLVVGPEGGFEPDEIDELKRAGAECFSLGPRRLRAVLAGVVATAAVLQVVGDLGIRTDAS